MLLPMRPLNPLFGCLIYISVLRRRGCGFVAAQSSIRQQQSKKLTLNSIKDTYIQGDANGGATGDRGNFGKSRTLLVGREIEDEGDGPLTARTLVFFDLSGIEANNNVEISALTRATLRLNLDRTTTSYTPCLEGSSAGCATVHSLVTEWGEGVSGIGGGDLVNGESSWVYSQYPDMWVQPGGDFLEQTMIGSLRPGRLLGLDRADFVLDVEVMKSLLQNATSSGTVPSSQVFHGFLIRQEDDSSLILQSRECIGGSCILPPRLVLEFEVPPTPVPTQAPLNEQSQQPQSDGNILITADGEEAPSAPPTFAPPLIDYFATSGAEATVGASFVQVLMYSCFGLVVTMTL